MSTLLTGVLQTDGGQQLVTQFKAALQAESEGISSLVSALTSGLLGLFVIFILFFLLTGGSAVKSVLKYIIPIGLIAAIIIAIVFGVHHPPNVLVTVISSIAAVILGVMEYFSLRGASKS